MELYSSLCVREPHKSPLALTSRNRLLPSCIWSLAQDGDPVASPGNLFPGQTPSWGLHMLSLWHPFSKLCPCALPAGAHGDSPVPSSFLFPPQQPPADAHCWFSLWCLIPPLVKWLIIVQRYHCHNALKSSETWSRLPRDNEKQTPSVQLRYCGCFHLLLQAELPDSPHMKNICRKGPLFDLSFTL